MSCVPSPRVTLILTAFNHEPFIAEAVRSVLAQSVANISIIIVDDGSSDRTADIIRNCIAGDNRVRYISQPNRGFSQVLAETIALVDTPYFGWVDGDDVLEPRAAELTLKALDDHPAASFAFTNHTPINEQGQPLAAGRAQAAYDKMRMLVDFMTFHFRLIRKSAYDAVGGIDVSFATAQDYDLCLKLAEAGDVVHVPESLYRYRIHSRMTSITKRVEQIESSRRAIAGALHRRGLDDKYALDVEIVGRFTLSPKRG